MRNKPIRLLTIGLLSFVCYSCGGGSSTDNSNKSSSRQSISLTASSSSSEMTDNSSSSQTSIESSSTSTVSSESSSSSSSVATSNLAPEFSLIFPNQNARTEGSTVTVRGIASDDKLVSAVLVNGINATLNRENSSSTNNKTRKLVNSSDEVSWEATIELPLGDIPITIEVIDNENTRTNNQGEEVILRNIRLPVILLDDLINNRYIGSEFNKDDVFIDKSTKAITKLAHPLNLDSSSILNNDSTAVYSAQIYDGILKVVHIELATGNKTSLPEINLQIDSETWLFYNVKESTYDPINNFYYLLIGQYPKDNSAPWESMILRIDLKDNSYKVITSSAIVGIDAFDISDLIYVNQNLFVLSSQFTNNQYHDQLWQINIDDGSAIPIGEPFDVLATHITADKENNIIYAAGYENIAKIFVESGAIDLISPDESNAPYNLAQIRGLLFNDANDQLLVFDSDISDVITISTTDGSRGYYIKTGIGDGARIITARHIAINSEKTIAYVLDDGSNAPEHLLKVDLSSGNRSELYAFDHAFNYMTQAIVLDEDNQRLFTAAGNKIGAFNLATLDFEPIVTLEEGWINNLVYDKNNNRLLFNSQHNLISSLDLEHKTVEVIYDTTSENDGTIINGNLALTLDSKRNHLLIYSYSQSGLYSLNLETGTRQLLIESCIDPTHYIENFNQLSSDSHREIFYDINSDSVWLTGDLKLLKIDMNTKDCKLVRSASFTPLSIYPLNDDIAMEGAFNSLHLVDFITGQSVIISR